MKNILITLSFIFIQNITFGQTFYEKIVKRFYTQIDSNHVLDCGDSTSEQLSLTYVYDIPEIPAPSSNITLENLHDFIVDYFGDIMVQELVENYNQIPADVRSQFAKSTYLVDAKVVVGHETKSSFEWISGQVKIKIMFQPSNKKFKRSFFKKLFNKV